MVNSSKIETSSLINAMESGEFYSSSGVSLKKVYKNNSKILIEIDPEQGVEYETIFMGLREGSLEIEELKIVKGIFSEYTFHEKDLFVRAKINSNELVLNSVIPGETKQAWVQPFVVKK
jgi:hypothetical protein